MTTKPEFRRVPDVIAKLEADRAQLIASLRDAEALRPRLLKDFGYVPEYVLDFCNKVRAALAKARP